MTNSGRCQTSQSAPKVTVPIATPLIDQLGDHIAAPTNFFARDENGNETPRQLLGRFLLCNWLERSLLLRVID